MSALKDRLDSIEERIQGACQRAGRQRSAVQLIAVSKRQPDSLLEEAASFGVQHFGENYVQELHRKQKLLSKANFHLIGPLQSNKAKFAVDSYLIHALSSLKAARALDRLASAETISALLQVNIGEEESKAGLETGDVEAFIEQCRSLERLRIKGLMCIPPRGQGPKYFTQLREFRDQLQRATGFSLPELSMGMSADFEQAIEAGATLIRVGTGIFGPRQQV